ncbi:MAG: hypothetical protein M1817_000503 [Caeruleum heppii]|nr:MAG: hypothetical protein M1817_000503 [Caeruleum heppii]
MALDSRKRNHQGDLCHEPDESTSMPSTQFDGTTEANDAHPPATSPDKPERLDSPALSSCGSMTTELVRDHTSGPAASPAKRRKLTVEEKEVKRQEKEARERLRVEQKAKRDEVAKAKAEEKRVKEEEKRQRDEERELERKQKEEEREGKKQRKEEEARVKEEDRRKKEEEKQRREEERLKKEKSQLRLGSFFGKPSAQGAVAPAAATSTAADFSDSLTQSRPTSMACPSNDLLPRKDSDYSRTFPPFFLQSHVTLAPWNRFSPDEPSAERSMTILDGHLNRDQEPESPRQPSRLLFELLAPALAFQPGSRPRRRRHSPSTKQLVTEILGSVDCPIDLTAQRSPHSQRQAAMLLRQLPVKVLQFAEDVRPPYRGTFTRQPPAHSSLGSGKNPFQRSLPDINYDYDSEAEWEEPEEGEDLDSEGDEEALSDDDADEMDGFLDDEAIGDATTSSQKRAGIGSNLDPVCSGLCWEDHDRQVLSADPSRSRPLVNLNGYRLEVIPGIASLPIDPFATSYWQKPDNHASPAKTSGTSTAMQPPRLPLQATQRSNVAMSVDLLSMMTGKESVATSTSVPLKVSKSKSAINLEDIEQFKDVVQGSDLTKAGLIEVLKKRFPKIPKDTIKEILNTVGRREGTKEAEKRWVVLDRVPDTS